MSKFKSNDKPTLLILASNPLHNGPRMIREIEGLKENFNIHITGSTPPTQKYVKYYNINRIFGLERLLKKIFTYVFGKNINGNIWFTRIGLFLLLRKIKPNYVIVHNPIFLPTIIKNKREKFKLIFNAHEFHPLEFESNLSWLNSAGKYCDFLYRNYLKDVDLMINVSDGIADRCLKEYHKKSIVIPNAAIYKDLKVQEVKDNIRIIHHGIPNKDRKLELMINAVKLLGHKYTLDLMVVENETPYFKSLVNLCENIPNVNIIPTVPFNAILSVINNYDIGVFILPPVSFNNLYSLPNKFFEFIQARLCVVVGPSPEMAKIVRDTKIGYVTEDFSEVSIYKTIKAITVSDIMRCKTNSDNIAKSYSAEKYYEELLDSILAL